MIHWNDVFGLQEEKTSEFQIIEGRFLTPLELFLPGLVPKESLNAHFQMILPLKWKDEKYKPLCVHLAGTGDHVSVVLITFTFDSFLFIPDFVSVLLAKKKFFGETAATGRKHRRYFARKSILWAAKTGASDVR